ncbi:MAG: signal peptidase II [Acutalibacteraceae bacterium]|nr:signal peptidase II [Oscillospiraceae bacterium]
MIQTVTLLVIATLVAADQLIKYLVTSNLNVDESCMRIPGFIEIRYCRNYGGMMGTFNNMGKILAAVTIVIILVGIGAIIFKKIKFGLPYVCITMILAGGIGNLIDRLVLGYVVDYINVLFVDFYIFNFADCLVTVGAFLLIFYEIYQLIKESGKKRKDNA